MTQLTAGSGPGLVGVSRRSRATAVASLLSIGSAVVVGRRWRGGRLITTFAMPALLMYVGLFLIQAISLSPGQAAAAALGTSANGIVNAVGMDKVEAVDKLLQSPGVSVERLTVRTGTLVDTGTMRQTVNFETANWASPHLQTLWQLHAGSWPLRPTEVALSGEAMKVLKVGLGGTLSVPAIHSKLVVVGELRDPTALDRIDVVASSSLSELFTDNYSAYVSFTLFGPPDSIASVATEAEGHGVGVNVRAAIVGQQRASLLGQQIVTVTVPAAVMIIALSAAAMILRVRRSGRQLAILYACGIRPSRLIAATRLSFFTVAALGSLIGVAVGAAVGALLRPWISWIAQHEPSQSVISASNVWLTIVFVTGVGTCSAWVPGRAVLRGLGTFDGGSQLRKPRPYLSGIGFLLAAIGIIGGVQVTSIPFIAVYLSLAFIGCLLALPAVTRGVWRLSTRGGFVSEVGLRQLARDPKRPTAAALVGVVMMIAAAGSLTYYSSFQAQSAAADIGGVPKGVAAIPLRTIGPTPGLLRDLHGAAGVSGKVSSLNQLVSTLDKGKSTWDRFPYWVTDASGSSDELFGVVTRDDFSGAVGREPSDAEWKAISEGQLVQFSGSATGALKLGVDPAASAPPSAGGVAKSRLPSGQPLPAPVQLDRSAGHDSGSNKFVVGQVFAKQFDLEMNTTYLTVWIPGHIDAGLGSRVSSVAERYGIAASEVVFHSGLPKPLPFDWRFIVTASTALLLLALGLTVLAMSEDARPFFQSLFALGIKPATQRRVLAVQSAAIALVAIIVGVPLGVTAGVASIHVFLNDASITWAVPKIALLCLGCIVGAAAVGVLKPGERKTSELSS